MSSDLVDHCLELLAPLGAVRAKRMFGGHGIYCDDLFFALIAGERLYLKTDDLCRPAFAAAGCEPFVYDMKGQAMTMSYWSVPAEAMESPMLMRPWALQALAAALRARAAKPSRKPAAPRKARAVRAQPQASSSRRKP